VILFRCQLGRPNLVASSRREGPANIYPSVPHQHLRITWLEGVQQHQGVEQGLRNSSRAARVRVWQGRASRSGGVRRHQTLRVLGHTGGHQLVVLLEDIVAPWWVPRPESHQIQRADQCRRRRSQGIRGRFRLCQGDGRGAQEGALERARNRELAHSEGTLGPLARAQPGWVEELSCA